MSNSDLYTVEHMFQ